MYHFRVLADDDVRSAPLPRSIDRRLALDFLDRLDRAHALLADAIRIMADQTTRPAPDVAGFSTARWRLSTASRQRRKLVASIVAALRATADAPTATCLDRFESEELQSLHQSVTHIHRWTPQSIAADWPGYCQASLGVRRAMRRRLEAEQALFQPILRTLAEPPPA